jgi:ABC-type glycerol-3-phosphate transport system substrate-binding protein
MTMKRLALLAFTSGLLACGGGSKSDTAATGNPCGDNPCATNPCGDPCGDPCAANPCAGGDADTGIDWSGWQSWTKINNAAFKSEGHKKPWVNVYVPAEHAETYKAGGEMPQGIAIVKSIHKDNGGAAGDAEVLTVMAKMGPDYDPDNGNWYYAAISPDGSKVMQEGKLEACLNCHSSGDDYLFVKKVVGN